MLHNVRNAATAALIGGALALGAGNPAAAADPTPAELKTQLDATNVKIDDIKKDIRRLTELLEGRRDSTGVVIPSDPGLVEQVKRLRDHVDALQTQVNNLKATSSSTSQRPATTGKGTVRVVNDYPVEISIVVNDRSYRVAAGTTLNVDVPVGDFSYQLLQAGAAMTRSKISDKEVVTLRVK